MQPPGKKTGQEIQLLRDLVIQAENTHTLSRSKDDSTNRTQCKANWQFVALLPLQKILASSSWKTPRQRLLTPPMWKVLLPQPPQTANDPTVSGNIKSAQWAVCWWLTFLGGHSPTKGEKNIRKLGFIQDLAVWEYYQNHRHVRGLLSTEPHHQSQNEGRFFISTPSVAGFSSPEVSKTDLSNWNH